jgi:hypothetical protein
VRWLPVCIAIGGVASASCTGSTEGLGRSDAAADGAVGRDREGPADVDSTPDALTEPADGSSVDAQAGDAGLGDAGLGDAGTECHLGLDCNAGVAQQSVSFCTATSAYSCIDGACVWDCAGARSCSLAGMSCIACGDVMGHGGSAQCPIASCLLPNEVVQGTIEQSTCGSVPGWPVPFDGSRITLAIAHGPTCGYEAHLEASPTELGSFQVLQDQTLLGQFPLLGGVCTGLQAPTNALRFVFSCPRCQLVLGF